MKDVHIIIRRVLEQHRIGTRESGGVGIGELADLIEQGIETSGHVIVHPDAITLPADQIAPGILIVEGERVHPDWCSGSPIFSECECWDMDGLIYPPAWVLDLLEPPRFCPDCHGGRRPFTLWRDEQWADEDGDTYTTILGVFVVADVQPRDDGRYAVLITEVPS